MNTRGWNPVEEYYAEPPKIRLFRWIRIPLVPRDLDPAFLDSINEQLKLAKSLRPRCSVVSLSESSNDQAVLVNNDRSPLLPE
jgi:hypothetical protein